MYGFCSSAKAFWKLLQGRELASCFMMTHRLIRPFVRLIKYMSMQHLASLRLPIVCRAWFQLFEASGSGKCVDFEPEFNSRCYLSKSIMNIVNLDLVHMISLMEQIILLL